MDDRTYKHSTKGLTTNVQQTTANIHVDGVEKKNFLFGVFFLLSTNEE